MNDELRAHFEEDQADRHQLVGSQQPHRGWLADRDRARRHRVDEIIASGAATQGEDFYHAATVFQHDETLDDYHRAHELAKRSAELGCRRGRWLAAAAYDRWLMRQLLPQKYGTQAVPVDGRWQMWEIDPATTAAERAAWDVPPPDETLRHMHEQLGAPPVVDMDDLPAWAREVYRRMAGQRHG
jgi:hypothetical protein